MRFLSKINLKRYLLLSAAITAITLFFAGNSTDVIAILIIYLATIANQFLLVEVIMEVVAEKTAHPNLKYRVRKFRVVTLFLLKLIILFGALSLGVHLMGKRVIIPLLNYVVLIFILGLSLKDVE